MLFGLNGLHTLVIVGVIAIIALVVIAAVPITIRLARKDGNHSMLSSPDPVQQIQGLAKL